MGNDRYSVIFKGDLLPGAGLPETKQKLATLYKTELDKIEPLFAGKPITLKDNLTMEEARSFIIQIQATGAKCFPVKKQTIPPPPPSPHTKPANPAKSSKPTPATFHEAHFSVKFKGEMVYGANPDDVKMKLCSAFNARLQQIETLFAGKPVTIKEAVDFFTAVDIINRFKSCGALCNLEIIYPAGKAQAEKHNQHVQPVQPTPAASSIPLAAAATVTKAAHITSTTPTTNTIDQDQNKTENEQIKKESAKLIESIAAVYQRVLLEFNIEKRSKRFETNETAVGCFFLLIAGALIAAVIWTHMKWWEGLLLGFGALIILGVFTKNWDLKYADIFLTRVQYLGKENPPLFLATLHSWAAGLAKTDRARQHLLEQIQNNINENDQLKMEVEKSAEQLGFKIKTPVELADLGNEAVEEEKPAKPVVCPRCGSIDVINGFRGFSWGKGILASAVLGPLGGAIIGGSKQNEPVYICQACRKKWKR